MKKEPIERIGTQALLPRIVKVSTASRRKEIATRKGRGSTPPYWRYNLATKTYEFVLEFEDENTHERYLVVAGQLDWERIIAGIQKVMEDPELKEQQSRG